jgi:adenylylsulfate kinase-like enzyme
MLDAGLIVIAAFVSPLRAHRDRVRMMVGEQRFLEVYVNTPIEICEKRDIKGYYAKARRGEIAEFTGVSALYEAPLNPDLIIDTNELNTEEAMQLLILALNNRGVQTI